MHRTNSNYIKTHDRYLYQGQEMDDEMKGEGNSVNYKYRMHDTRLGRFFAIDLLAVKHPYSSSYSFVRNNPIIRIEKEGNTDFYFNGKYVGTDGVDNGMIGLVRSKEVANTINNNKYDFTLGVTPGISNDFVVIDYNVLKGANEILDLALSIGQTQEFGAEFAKQPDGRYEMTSAGIIEGPEAPLEGEVSGSVDVPTNLGSVSVHSHRTGMGLNGEYASSELPSPTDISLMPLEDMTIIAGKAGETVIDINDVPHDNRLKSGTLEFYDKNNTSSALSISGLDVKKILKQQIKPKK